jgi:hypothetical protein
MLIQRVARDRSINRFDLVYLAQWRAYYRSIVERFVAGAMSALQPRVVGLDGLERCIDANANVGLLGLGTNCLPASRGRHPEHVGHGVVVALFQCLRMARRVRQVELTCLVRKCCFEFSTSVVEGVADVGVSRMSSNVPVPVMVPIQITTMGPLVVL